MAEDPRHIRARPETGQIPQPAFPHVKAALRFVVLATLLFWARARAADDNGLTNLWLCNVGSLTDSSPAIGTDGTIFVGSFGRKLWAIQPNGKPKWVFEAGLQIWSSPAVTDDGTVYFGCRDRNLYALSADGRKKWSFKTGGWVDSSPAIAADGTVYFGSWDTNFYALNADGSRKWEFPTGGPIVSSPAIARDGTIYFGSHDRKFYALTADGKKRWEFAATGPIISSPALQGTNCVYVTSVDGFFYALNLDGTVRWKLKTGGVTQSSPVIGSDGTLFVGVNEELWAITPEGRQKWTRGFGCPLEATPLAFEDGSVCVVCRWGFMNCLDLERAVRWGAFLAPYGYSSPAVGTNGTVYALRDFVYLAALPTTVPLAQSPWPKFRGDAANTGRQKN